MRLFREHFLIAAQSPQFRADARDRLETDDEWVSKETAAICGVVPREDFITMGWLFQLCERMPDAKRTVIVNAALWGVHGQDAPSVDSCPFDKSPVVPRVMAQLKIPYASLPLRPIPLQI